MGFDVVQVKHGPKAGGRNPLPVGRAPGMFDETDFIARTADGFGYFPVETGEAVDQGRDSADHAAGIAGGARRVAAAG